MPREYWVYILANDSRELYVGITGNLIRRVSQHREDIDRRGYTTRHQTKRLVYCEATNDVQAALRREKQIKGWTRRRKLKLIETLNPDWSDLAEGW
jgi:putative endonuclease